jgi:predicted small lipoprotein YifL
MTTASKNNFGSWVRRITLLTLLATLALPLAACGKKGPLDPPPGAENNQFPRQYPNQ